MGFVDPKKEGEEDQALPGATGLHLDLELKRCPACRRELTPWQERCPDCGEVGVRAGEVRADRFHLPGLADEEADADGSADPDDTEADDTEADDTEADAAEPRDP